MTALDDAQAEADAGPGNVTFEWDGQEFTILPPGKWRSSALAALNRGDFDTWAAKTLVDGTYETWQEIDPTVDEAKEFLLAWKAAAGQDPKGSRRSPGSSRSTKKR